MPIAFDAPQSGSFDCRIFNMQGQQVLQKTMVLNAQNDGVLDVSALNNGLYFFENERRCFEILREF